MDSAEIRRDVLRLLNAKLGAGFQNANDERLIDRSARETCVAIEIEVTKKGGTYAIDPYVAVYWDRYSVVVQHIIANRPMDSATAKPWETPAAIIDYQRLSDRAGTVWNDLYIQAPEDVVGVVESIAVLHDGAMSEVSKCATVGGFAQYVRDDPRSVGTWRPTLQYLFDELINGRAYACKAMSGSEPVTVWERRQMSWLFANLCDGAI